MSNKKTSSYEAYLRKNISNSQKLTKAFSKQFMQQPQQMPDNAVLNVGDNSILIDQNADANKHNVPIDSQLFDLLTPYIQDVNNINKIVNDTKLTDQLKEYLVYNWDTDVVPKLNAFKNKRVDISTVTSLLIRIATQLLTIDSQAEVNKTQQEINKEFLDKSRPFFEKTNYTTAEKATYCDILIQSKLELNKEKLAPLHTALTDTITRGYKGDKILGIVELFKIDRLYDNFQKTFHDIKGTVLANIKPDGFAFARDVTSDAEKIQKSLHSNKLFGGKPDVDKFIHNYFNQIETYSYIKSLPLKEKFLICKIIYDNETSELIKFITPLLPTTPLSAPVVVPVGAPAPLSSSGASALSGTGLMKKGTGFETGMSQQHAHHLNEKFMLNKHKLRSNILEIRYIKNGHLVPIKAQYVSNALKSMITKRLNGDYTVDKTLFNELSDTEKHLYRSLAKYFDIDSGNLPDDDDQMDARAQIVFGELQAGNNNPDIKKEAYKYLIHAYQMKKITYADFVSLIKNYGL